jgi:predicted RNA-binding protein associated with RNAse of E/G family
VKAGGPPSDIPSSVPSETQPPPSDEAAGSVEIHYRRLPAREQCFRQAVLEDAGDRVVTFLASAELPGPVSVGGNVVLEPGSPVVWTTYRGLWHDVGRFHLADGTFTGTYANVLTPVQMDGARWTTTDLCLDVWMGAGGELRVLDEDELDHALGHGWISPETAARARQEAERLVDAARQGAWPPAHVAEWTLERARSVLAARGSAGAAPPARLRSTGRYDSTGGPGAGPPFPSRS